MASSASVALLLFFTIFEAINAAQQRNQPSNPIIRLGHSLSPYRQPSWNSSSGRFQIGFYKQGTGFSVGIWLVTSPNITVVWTANRDKPPVSSYATLTLTIDGLILRTQGREYEDIARTSYEQASFASMLDSGNFVLYNNRSSIIWQSFDIPTDTILGGQSLYVEKQTLCSATETNSSTGRFCLKMQEDRNLVLYPSSSINSAWDTYWSFETKLDTLILTRGGILQVAGGIGAQIIAKSSYSANSSNETRIYRATLDTDGILRLYSHNFKNDGNSNVYIQWSALQKQCLVKGFCGLNSFCSTSTNNSTKGECYCFHGFNFINPEMKFLGCYRNFSDEEGCKRKMPAQFYNITSFENTQLGGLAYAKLPVSKEGCSKSCLNDCYCGAAFYSNESCSKYKFPLMFAMRDQNMPSTLFMKWSSGQANLNTQRNSPRIKNEVVADHKKNLLQFLQLVWVQSRSCVS